MPKLRLGNLIENLGKQLAVADIFIQLETKLCSIREELLTVVHIIGADVTILENSVTHRQALPGAGQVNLTVAVLELETSDHFLSDMADQVLYSKDGSAMVTNLAVTWEIVCPRVAFLCAEEIDELIPGLVMDCAREYAKTKDMEKLLSKKNVSHEIIKNANDEAKEWGVNVTGLMITDFRPHNIMLIGEMLKELNNSGLSIRIEDNREGQWKV